MRRAIFVIPACLLVSSCDQPQSGGSTLSPASSGPTTYESVQTAAGGAFEQVAMIEATDPNVVQAGARQVASSGYACGSASHVWKLSFTKDVGMTILKVRCSSGADYQITLFDNKAFAKPWTGRLLGG